MRTSSRSETSTSTCCGNCPSPRLDRVSRISRCAGAPCRRARPGTGCLQRGSHEDDAGRVGGDFADDRGASTQPRSDVPPVAGAFKPRFAPQTARVAERRLPSVRAQHPSQTSLRDVFRLACHPGLESPGYRQRIAPRWTARRRCATEPIPRRHRPQAAPTSQARAAPRSGTAPSRKNCHSGRHVASSVECRARIFY